MDFFKKAVSSATQSDEPAESGSQVQLKKHSTTELFSSAKVVASAAQDTFGNKSENVDKGKVAGAAGDLLGGAKEYGNLKEDTGFGKYVGQAETYLHSYGSSGDKKVEVVGKVTPAVVATDAPAEVVADAPEKVVVEEEKKVVEEVVDEKKGGADVATPTAGAGDYFKVAEGLLK